MKKIQHILIPVDFNLNNNKAIQLAALIAKPYEAQITLLHVYTRPLINRSLEKILDSKRIHRFEQLKLKIHERQITNKFRELYTAHNELNELKVRFVKVKGTAFDEIMHYSKKLDIDMIIMGTSGLKKEQHRQNTLASKISVHANVPVLIAPYDMEFDYPVKIAFAYDLKPIHNLQLIDHIKLVSEALQSQVHILGIKSNDIPISPEENEHLNELKNYLSGYHSKITIINKKLLKSGLTYYLFNQGISLVTVMHRSRNFLRKLFHKSLTKRMAQHARVPILALNNKS